MRKLFLIIIGILFLLHARSQETWKHGRLQVSKNNQSLEFTNGTPFFWLGDTAWEIFLQLKINEIRKYLDKRQAQGFNVIQVTLVMRGQENTRNRYGQYPFRDKSFKKPNESYFSLVDSAVSLARDRNMFIALLPAWGDVALKLKDGNTMVLDSSAAAFYGFWLGKRYKKDQNIIWVMAGDTNPLRDSMDTRPVWRTMAKNIIKATGHNCLITYHPPGARSSSEWMHDEDWLDMNMIQSSHGRRDAPTWTLISRDLEKNPKKPSIDGEPNYEDHPVNPWPSWDPKSGYFRDYDVRKQCYRSVFAGAPGVTYGHHAVWQFLNERTEVINHADRGWVNAIDRPGAWQVGFLRALMESRMPLTKIRDTSLLVAGQGDDAQHAEAFFASDSSFAMLYLPVGKKIIVNLKYNKAAQVAPWWFNPRDGTITKETTRSAAPELEFTPPETGEKIDWVLVIDDATRKFPLPKKIHRQR